MLVPEPQRSELFSRALPTLPTAPPPGVRTWLLKRHPEVAAAYVADSPALAKDAVAGGPVLSSAL